MEEILAQQHNRSKPVSVKVFFEGVLSVILRLAIAQILFNLLIAMTGLSLLNVGLYLCAIALVLRFMIKLTAGSLYMLKEKTLYLQKMLGDSTILKVEIPLENVISIRPVFWGERLKCSYHRVKVIDSSAAQPIHMHLAFGVALLSARLAQVFAGECSMELRAHIAVYEEEGKRNACVFLPDEQFKEELRGRLPDVCDMDERTRRNTPVTLWAQALEHAFPPLYTHVPPLVSDERVQAAHEEIERQKQKKAEEEQRQAYRARYRKQRRGRQQR